MRLIVALCALAVTSFAAHAQGVPQFTPEPFWPKPLPENWILGQVAGIAADRNDHIWIMHRPLTLLDDEKGAQTNPPSTKCCTAAPPVMEFDADGNLLRHWGGAGAGYNWLKNEHGIHVDRDGNVWVGGNEDGDQILKFTPDGKFLMQVGKNEFHHRLELTDAARPAGAHDDQSGHHRAVRRRRLQEPARHRVRCQDRRLQAPLGRLRPRAERRQEPELHAERAAARSSSAIRCTACGCRTTGCVYVCDRANDRIQVFKPDGTFVKEFRVETATLQNGSVWDLVLSSDPEQKYIFIADGANGQIITLAARERQDAHRSGAATAASPGSSSGCTTSRSTRRATSTPPKSASAGACRNSTSTA